MFFRNIAQMMPAYWFASVSFREPEQPFLIILACPSSRDVGPAIGLPPHRYQSGEIDIVGGVTKAGDMDMRTALD